MGPFGLLLSEKIHAKYHIYEISHVNGCKMMCKKVRAKGGHLTSILQQYDRLLFTLANRFRHRAVKLVFEQFTHNQVHTLTREIISPAIVHPV